MVIPLRLRGLNIKALPVTTTVPMVVAPAPVIVEIVSVVVSVAGCCVRPIPPWGWCHHHLHRHRLEHGRVHHLGRWVAAHLYDGTRCTQSDRPHQRPRMGLMPGNAGQTASQCQRRSGQPTTGSLLCSDLKNLCAHGATP